MDIRPRTLGEICDDAWRLVLADAPLLLLYNALFLVPAFIVLLLLLAQPVPSGIGQYGLPALAAVLLPLTGLASGACQELLQRRFADPQRKQGQNSRRTILQIVHSGLDDLQNRPTGVLPLLALRRGLEHAAARAVLLCLTLPGPLLLLVCFFPDTSPILRFAGFLFGSLLTFLLSLPVWVASTSLHLLLSAGAGNSGTLLHELRRDVAAARGKSAVLVLSRLPLLLFLALQLHLFAKVVLWVADNLGGFDTTLLDVQLGLFAEPVYTTALFLLSWLLSAPFFEAGNFLLHTDIRTRQEGLDLQYRVQRAFAGVARITEDQTNRPDAKDAKNKRDKKEIAEKNFSFIFFVLGVLGVFGVFAVGSPPIATAAQADQSSQETVRAVRQGIEAIRAEIDEAEPYPGGQRWMGRLRGLQTKLSRIGGDAPRRFRWFEQALDDFADRKKEDALRILDDLRRRLLLLEGSLAPPREATSQARDKHSPDDIKSLLRGNEANRQRQLRGGRRKRVEEDRLEIRREEVRGKGRQGDAPREGGRGTPVSVPAASGGGLSFLGWMLLGGLASAVVVAGVILYLTSPKRRTGGVSRRVSAGTAGESAETDAGQVMDGSPAALWRQADALAGEGRFRDAVRMAYLAVLALLHRQRFIRFEPTRTNGEYVRQVRLSEQAPPQLHEPFEQLTHQFETAWYGEGSCEGGDYRTCRALADEMQQLAESVR